MTCSVSRLPPPLRGFTVFDPPNWDFEWKFSEWKKKKGWNRFPPFDFHRQKDSPSPCGAPQGWGEGQGFVCACVSRSEFKTHKSDSSVHPPSSSTVEGGGDDGEMMMWEDYFNLKESQCLYQPKNKNGKPRDDDWAGNARIVSPINVPLRIRFQFLIDEFLQEPDHDWSGSGEQVKGSLRLHRRLDMFGIFGLVTHPPLNHRSSIKMESFIGRIKTKTFIHLVWLHLMNWPCPSLLVCLLRNAWKAAGIVSANRVNGNSWNVSNQETSKSLEMQEVKTDSSSIHVMDNYSIWGVRVEMMSVLIILVNYQEMELGLWNVFRGETRRSF